MDKKNNKKPKLITIPYLLTGEIFEIISQNNNKVVAKCLHCPEGNKYKGSLKSTGNFHMHIKRKHPDLVDKIKQMKVIAKKQRYVQVPKVTEVPAFQDNQNKPSASTSRENNLEKVIKTKFHNNLLSSQSVNATIRVLDSENDQANNMGTSFGITQKKKKKSDGNNNNFDENYKLNKIAENAESNEIYEIRDEINANNVINPINQVDDNDAVVAEEEEFPAEINDNSNFFRMHGTQDTLEFLRQQCYFYNELLLRRNFLEIGYILLLRWNLFMQNM